MMKSFVFKSLIAACVTSVAILSTAKVSMAQVNTSFLTEVAESCQKDVFSSKYYQPIGYKHGVDQNSNEANFYLSSCIRGRYFYLQVISKFPWLVSTDEMLAGYPGAVAVTQIAYKHFKGQNTNLLDCLASEDSSSQECTKLDLQGLYNRGNVRWRMLREDGAYSREESFYAYVCPSCVVVHNNNPSKKRMIGAFKEWFIKLEPSQRKELISILGDERTQQNNRTNMKNEANEAWYEYTAIRRRIAEEEKERRRRELLGE